MEREQSPSGTSGPEERGAEDRDADLVTLEGLESELGDLDADLARVERADDTTEREAAPPVSGGRDD